MRTITVYLEEDEEEGRARRRGSPARALVIAGLIAVTAIAMADRGEESAREVVVVPDPIVRTETVLQLVSVPATCEPFGPPAPEVIEQKQPRPRVIATPTLSPSVITFHQAGWESVAILNPNRVAIRIRRIDVRGEAFEIYGSAQCVGILRPGEHCRFNVFAHDAAFRKPSATRIDVHYDGSAKPVTTAVRSAS